MMKTSNKGTILVVDDASFIRNRLSTSLTQEGYSVETAKNGKQALEILAAGKIDLVLLDLIMPEMNGTQMMEIMRADPVLRKTPVIVISASVEIDDIVQSIKMGAADHLPKEVNPILLHARIEATLANKKLRDIEALMMRQVQREKKLGDALLNIVIPMGVQLSREKDFNLLVEKALIEAMTFSKADAGILYINTGDTLKPQILHCKSLEMKAGGTSEDEVPSADIPLYFNPQEPNNACAAVRSILNNESINITKIDSSQSLMNEFPVTETLRMFYAYPVQSILISPLKVMDGEVIGALELINATDEESGKTTAFDSSIERLILSYSMLAAAALESYQREQHLRTEIFQLQIIVDEAAKWRQVDEITTSEYFVTLKEKANDMRSKRSDA